MATALGAANPLNRALHLVMAFALVLTQLMLLAPSTAFGAPVVTVNSSGDGVDINPGDLVCSTGATNSEGAVECTLRAAIQEANASGPVDEIFFAIPLTDPGHSGGTFLIRPGTGLPYLSQRVVLDGATQPGYSGWPVVIVDGSAAASNADGPDGLLIDGNQVTVRGLVVRNWRDDGIEIHGNRATIIGNYIHHNDDGVLIENGSRNVIGDGNVISGNRKHGVSIDRGSDNEVRGSYIGLTSDGTSAMPNSGNGVEIWGGTIRAAVGPGNVISGNDGIGINVTGTAGRTDIFDNLVGLDADGAVAVGNTGHGIEISDTGAGTFVGTGNVVSGNGGYGIVSAPSSARVVVSGNRVGTNGSGSSGLANASAGVRIASGNADVIDNQISGNDGSGLEISGAGAVVTTNLIGTDATGTTAIGNGGNGITVTSGAAPGDIGGIVPSQGNVIAFNGGVGVGVGDDADTSVSINSNLIFANGGMSIDLPKIVGASDPNDPNDTDSGANDLLNYPVITSAEETAGDVYVNFDLDVPNGWYRVEFYTADGQTLASSVMVLHTNLVESFSHIFSGSDGDELTSTATRCNDEICSNARFTSEFSATHTITIGNHEPVIGPISPQTVDEEETLVYTVPASDFDLDTLTFSLSGPDLGAVIDPSTGVFTWTPTEEQGPDTHTFDITVTDNGSPVALSDTASLTVTVNEVNQAPVMTDPGDQIIEEGSTLSFTVTATDPDFPANTLTYTLDAAPAGAVIDPSTGVFTWTPSEEQGPDTYTFDITVNDNGSPVALSDTASLTVTVNEVNEPPVITHPGDQSNAEGDSVGLDIIATDPDLPANTLTYTANGLPPGLTIDPATGRIAGVIDYQAAAGTPYAVTLTVTDDGAPEGDHSLTFTWDTANTNRPPVLTNPGNKTVNEQTTLTFNASATDPDLDTILTYTLNGAPAGAAIDPSTGVFTWTPTEAQGPNTYTFDITVDDNGSPNLTHTRTITVTVDEVNRTPFLATPGNQTVNEQTTLTFTASATDPDLPANTLTYTLSRAPAGAAIDPSTGVFTWTPTEAQGPNTYTFDITVTDNGSPNLTHTRTITVTVNEVNQTPSATNPGNQTNAEGDEIDLTITATDPDLPANTLTYTATGLPPGLTINSTTGRITGQIQYHAAENSPYTTHITVTDNGSPSLAHTRVITWDTANTNRPPVLANPGNKTFDEQTTLTFNASATDPDTGTILTYHLTGAPSGAAIDPNTGVFTWTPTEAQGPNTYTFDITAWDDDVASLSHTRRVMITVAEVNTPPVAGDDAAVTNEDNPVTVTVLANDSDVDLPANRLGVSSVQRPEVGQAIVTRSGKITYIPPANYHGTVVFDYTVSDGSDTDTASVSIVVNSINDAPVAGDDEYRLTRYRPTQLHVLDNDADADGDPLGISLITYPDKGVARVEGDYLVYEPINGWTGSVNFSYRVRDRHGAAATANVKILVGDEVLVGARNLATNLGVDIVSFEPPSTNFDAATLSLIDLDGITLLADSFFQTVDALRIPLGFLGVTVVMVVGLGTTAKVPALVFGSRRRHWAVVRLGRQQRLPAYSEPGGRKVVYNYDPTADGIVSIGKSVTIGNTEWLPVDTPNGKAWIYRKYLTEQLDLHAFLDDTRPTRLVHELAARLRSGRSIDALISSEGLMIALTGSPSQIASDQVAALMGDRRLRHLAGTDGSLNTPQEFAVAVAEPFLEAYDAAPDVSPDVAHSRSALIPTECWNFPYLAIGTGTGVQPWLVFFEYRDGKAFIAGIGIDE